MNAPRKLPAFSVLHDLYVKQGMSLAEIAGRYDVRDREAVRKALRRGAQAAGMAWPLEGVRASLPERMRRHHGSVPAIGIRMEIADAVDRLGMTKREIAEQADVAESVVVRLSNGRQETVTIEVRDRLLAVIVRAEKRGMRRERAIHALNARRAKLAREKAAGQRPLSQRDRREGRRYVA